MSFDNGEEIGREVYCLLSFIAANARTLKQSCNEILDGETAEKCELLKFVKSTQEMLDLIIGPTQRFTSNLEKGITGYEFDTDDYPHVQDFSNNKVFRLYQAIDDCYKNPNDTDMEEKVKQMVIHDPTLLITNVEGSIKAFDEAHRDLSLPVSYVSPTIPLHWVTEGKLSNLAKFFIRQCPSTVGMPIGDKLPIHYAAWGCDLETCRLLLDIYPHGASQPDEEGRYPLHLLLNHREKNDTEDLIHLLIDICPAALKSKLGPIDWVGQPDYEGGGIALHIASKRHDLNIVKFIYEAFPQGGLLKTTNGDLPLHFVTRNGGYFDNKAQYLAEKTHFAGLFDVGCIDPNDFYHRDHVDQVHLWEISDMTPWGSIWDYHKDRAATILSSAQNLRLPIIQDAIGKIPVKQIQFLVNTVKVYIGVSPKSFKTALSFAIKEASEALDSWEIYFRQVISIIFSGGCDKSDRRNNEVIDNSHSEKLVDKDGRFLLHHIACDENKLPWPYMKDIVNGNCGALGIDESYFCLSS